jgi:hypothetical protein
MTLTLTLHGLQSASYLNETGKTAMSARDRSNRYKKRQKGGDGEDDDGVSRVLLSFA